MLLHKKIKENKALYSLDRLPLGFLTIFEVFFVGKMVVCPYRISKLGAKGLAWQEHHPFEIFKGVCNA